MNTQRSIWAHYKNGWTQARLHYRAIILVYVINLLLAFLAIGPISNILKKAFSQNLFHDKISSGFDYTLLTEVLRKYDVGVQLSISMLGSFIILYLLWAIFYIGGFVGLIREGVKQEGPSGLANFWRGGSSYFFRYLRLSIYTMAFMGLSLAILGITFFSDSNPFTMVSEGPLITKMYLFVAIALVLFFLVSLFKDIAKLYIANKNPKFIQKINSQAIKDLFKKNILSLAVINFSLLILGVFAYLQLKKLLGGFIIPLLILGQIFIFFRVLLKMVRLGSYASYMGTE